MSFACHNDLQLGSFSTANILMVLDTTTKGTVNELKLEVMTLNLEQLPLTPGF